MGGLGFVVVGHARPGADLSRAGDDVEGGRVGALQRVGQRVAVGVGGGQGGADVLARGRVLGHAAGRGVGGERRRVVGDNHGSGHLEDRREPVQEAAHARRDLGVGEEGAVTATGGVGPADAHLGRAERPLLGAVVAAAGEGPVAGLGGIGAVGAGLVLVVGLVVPGPVVEILVLVGGLGAVEPVDGHALVGRGVGGFSVVSGVDGGAAADHPEARAVGPDVGVAGRGAGLDEGVVVRDIGGGDGARRRGEEQ